MTGPTQKSGSTLVSGPELRDGSDGEHGTTFAPQFDASGLLPAIVTDRASKRLLMFAFMNPEALELTVQTGFAHFWSRSRSRLWKKGEESGNLLRVAEVRTDCDQDVIQLVVDVEGSGVACHTGAVSCFYRRLVLGAPVAGLLQLVPE